MNKNNKKDTFYIDKDNVNDEEWTEGVDEYNAAPQQAWHSIARADNIGLIHYVKRVAERSEDGRWRVMFAEIRTYNADTYRLDKLAGSVAAEFSTDAEYEMWLRQMGLPAWALTQGELM